MTSLNPKLLDIKFYYSYLQCRLEFIQAQLNCQGIKRIKPHKESSGSLLEQLPTNINIARKFATIWEGRVISTRGLNIRFLIQG